MIRILPLVAALPAVVLAALHAVSLPAQEPPRADQRQLVERRARKLAQPVFQKADWLTDYDQARARAKEEGKLVFACFTRSHIVCGPCETLENGALADPGFPQFAKDVVLFLHVTSQVAGEPLPTLPQDKGLRSFPSLCFLDADGNVVTQPRRHTVAAFAATHARARTVVTLRAKGDKATPEERRALFLAELGLGLIPTGDIQARADRVALTDAERALVARKLVDAEIDAVMADVRTAGPDKTDRALAAIHKAGRKPSADVNPAYWVRLLQRAAKLRDGALADEAYAALLAAHGTDAGAERALAAWKQLRDDAQPK